jgi:peptidoglycan hydrolase CwlO-like protein
MRIPFTSDSKFLEMLGCLEHGESSEDHGTVHQVRLEMAPTIRTFENTSKHVKEWNKTIQDLKMEVETINKSQRETTLEIGNLGKKSGAKITRRRQEIEERISAQKIP